MIIFRYLARELLATMFAISFVVLLISLSGRFVRYLADAAAGRLEADVLFIIMGYRIPGFLELILPLGFFLGILFAYGKLYMESEMTVLSACGFSQQRILAYTMAPALLVAALVAGLSLYLTPAGLQQVERLLDQQSARSQFDTVQAARFQAVGGGSSIAYIESMSDDRSLLQNIFLAQSGALENRGRKMVVVEAAEGERVDRAEYGQRYLELRDGRRYFGRPGGADYQVTEFETFAQHLAESPDAGDVRVRIETVATAQLFDRDDLEKQAALQWRLSMPLLVLVVALLAVPLSKTNPRQGRYLKMLPAIVLYFVYLACLTLAKGAVEDGRIPVAVGIWWVHGIFLLLAIVLLGWGRWKIFWQSSFNRGVDTEGGARA